MTVEYLDDYTFKCSFTEPNGRFFMKMGVGNLWEPFNHGELTFDIVVSNPPYIASEDYETLPPEVRIMNRRWPSMAVKAGCFLSSGSLKGPRTTSIPGDGS